MKKIFTIAAAALITQPLAAHPPSEQQTAAPAQAVQNPDEPGVRSILSQYCGSDGIFTRNQPLKIAFSLYFPC